jgi:predicted CoA-binding protein
MFTGSEARGMPESTSTSKGSETMSKYFVEPINPKPAPTFEQRVESAIRDIEKRLDILEKEWLDKQ